MLIVTPNFISWYTNGLQLSFKNTVYLQKNYPISRQIWTCPQPGKDSIWVQWKTTEYWDIFPKLSFIPDQTYFQATSRCYTHPSPFCLEVRCFNVWPISNWSTRWDPASTCCWAILENWTLFPWRGCGSGRSNLSSLKVFWDTEGWCLFLLF